MNGSSGSGRFDVLGVKVIDGGSLLVDNPVQVNVKNALRLTGEAVLAPSVPSILPGDVRFDIEGRGAKLGKGALAELHVRAPNGKITVGRGTLAIGRLVGQKIRSRRTPSLSNLGGCGDGIKQGTEICDTSAANGDGACPGNCIPLGEGRPVHLPVHEQRPVQRRQRLQRRRDLQQRPLRVLGTPPDCDDDNRARSTARRNSGCIQVPVRTTPAARTATSARPAISAEGGVCVPGGQRACNDGNDCTADACDPVHGCSHTSLGTGLACSDGDACTQADACIRGDCISGTTVSCDDTSTLHGRLLRFARGLQAPTGRRRPLLRRAEPLLRARRLPGRRVHRSRCADLQRRHECTVGSCTPVGPVGQQTPQCSSTNATNFTPCGPNGTEELLQRGLPLAGAARPQRRCRAVGNEAPASKLRRATLLDV